MFLQLTDTEPLASGRMRLVFRHPHDAGLLIKVIRPEVIDERWGSGLVWYKTNRRFRQYISFIREIEEYVATYARYGRNLPFLQKVSGFVETDYGLGLVLQAAMNEEGELAKTLWRMVLDREFDEAAGLALQRFFDQILATDIVVADLHPGNLVYAYDKVEGYHFVMIDGLGVSTIIPFKALSRTLNRRSKMNRIKRLRLRIEARLMNSEIQAKV